MSAFAVEITDTATLVLAADSINREVFVYVNSNSTVYLGDSADVSVAEGFPVVKHTAPIRGTLGPGAPLYAICDPSVTVDLRVWAAVD
jgi:hypothetical protein